MNVLGINRMFLDTRSYLQEQLEDPPEPSAVFLRFATPLIAIRSVAVMLRGLLMGNPTAGVVLALGNFVLQMGVWLAIGFALPVLVKQVGNQLDDRAGFAVVTYASCPLWIAGALYLIPEEPPLTFFWSRSLVAALAGFGVYVLYRSFELLEVRSRTALVAATTLGYTLTYVFLFALVGLSTTILLLVLQAS